MDNKPDIPDISEVDFDTRLKVLLGVPPEREKVENDDATRLSSTESDPDK